jgi:short-subunit dehydrogenase
MKKYSCCVITGASSGIGLELARLIAPMTSRLVLVARTESRLREISAELEQKQGVETSYLLADLEKQGSGETLWSEIQSMGLYPDVWVNNAGFGLYGSSLELSLEREQAMIQLNITALVTLSTLAARSMALLGGGTVLNVSSVAAFLPGPRMAVYFASKAFVLSYSQALNEELSKQGVRVLVLCPGSTRTDFHKIAGTERVKAMHQLSSMSATDVAKSALAQMQSGNSVNIPGLLNQLMVFSSRLVPRRLGTWLSGHVLRVD